MKIKLFSTLAVTSSFIFTAGCSDSYDPVPSSKCSMVVKHSTDILKKLAKPKEEMIKECRKATDEQRGCVMQAKIVADLAKCTKL